MSLFSITKLADMSHSLFEIHLCNIYKQLEKSKQQNKTNRIKSFILNVTVYFGNMGMNTQKLKQITKQSENVYTHKKTTTKKIYVKENGEKKLQEQNSRSRISWLSNECER